MGYALLTRKIDAKELVREEGGSKQWMAAAGLNAGDVFILDLGTKLIQWNGSEANRKEKAKALDVCVGIKEERGGKVNVIACEQGAEPDDFWEALGGRAAVPPPLDDSSEKVPKSEAKLIKVSDAAATVRIESKLAHVANHGTPESSALVLLADRKEEQLCEDLASGAPLGTHVAKARSGNDCPLEFANGAAVHT